MRVVFLDIDGVLNSAETWPMGHRGAEWIDPRAMERVNHLCLATDAAIVVSSTWRLGRSTAQLQAMLQAHGLDPRVVVLGKTPHRPGEPRGSEIQQWLTHEASRHGRVERFVILDDDQDMGSLSPWLVRTTWASGLQDCHVEQAVAVLRGQVTVATV